ncbi:flagellar biosynthetic protein FliR [Desulforhopalus sp. IMCC35007]|uniref:flagellar biosynthetic protein FliR n=1 Tax=Desulforhopalus sp. IMCC35007 TaxID=2569543 RepID=UPI0010AEDB10|nr:flagellar biosynthetic protein FliR [Desulforhopalus sp. IMCC35007]TKB10279.1 flagellar biosynthetic protein FliR [Desulforhopalus sp. IMCC35007]
MDTQFIPVEQFQIFLIITARVAGFISAIPVFSTSQTPTQVKIGLTVLMSLLLFPLMEPSVGKVSLEITPFAMLIIAEVLLGLMIGLIARLIFTAVEFGATVIGFQMGFAAANVFDPQNQRQVALISQFQNVFSILIFLALNGHHIFIRTAVRSYELLPPGQFNFSGEAVPYLFELSSHMFALGVQFSAPVLTVLLLSGLILGILARVFPQLNVFLISFPINIGTAFIVIALTLPLIAMLLGREFDSLPERFSTILQYLAN